MMKRFFLILFLAFQSSIFSFSTKDSNSPSLGGEGGGRPSIENRRFHSDAVEKKIESLHKKLLAISPKLWNMFQNCYPNTLDTTIFPTTDGSGDVFVITGDIDAMWLRDSGAQVWPYLRYVNQDPKLKEMIKGVIRQQFRLICLDPYANAFLHSEKDSTYWTTDYTTMKPGVHERKYEIDSLCYPLRLAYEYWKQTGDDSIFDDLFMQAMGEILRVFREQQRLDGNEKTSYTFQRTTHVLHDTVSNYGYGHPVKPCGLIASFFRPSDDSCIFPFLVPSNFFAESVLRKACAMLSSVHNSQFIVHSREMAEQCQTMADQIHDALEKYAIVETEDFGKVFAFEVDGYGSRLLMDDGNAPSLLSLPYLCPELVDMNNPVYQNTRRMIWSENNPYFFKGQLADGTTIGAIGSPHTGLGNVWPMSIIMKGLTTNDKKEQQECLELLMKTDGETGFMHESFNPSNPKDFTRKWFAWANGLFGELVMKIYDETPHFVGVRGNKLMRNGAPYVFSGTNMWYAAILGSEGQGGDRNRLCQELDELKSRGIMNIRVLAGGSDGVSQRDSHIWPSLQPEAGVYNDTILQGLDFLMSELEKRDMTAVLYLNNSWDWSGGFGTYLEWAGKGVAPLGSDWDNYEKYHSDFTKNKKAMKLAADHTRFMVSRINTVTGKPYKESPALMAWEICNEPRPFARDKETKTAFAKWIGAQAKLIKSIDPNHLVTTGSEGYYGCAQDTTLLREIHSFPEIDYCCIHIWPHNWNWLGPCIGNTTDSKTRNGVSAPQDSLQNAIRMTDWYLDLNYKALSPLGKPIVVEEYGYPRDNYEIVAGTPVTARKAYYKHIQDLLYKSGKIAATNFWGWGGNAKVIHPRWQKWDPYVADPAQEEQGLYSVFTSPFPSKWRGDSNNGNK